MAITNRTDLGVSWVRNDWNVGDPITEKKLDSVENGVYILMNDIYGNQLREKIEALEGEIGGTRKGKQYDKSRLDQLENVAGGGRSAVNLIGAGDIIDYDVPVLEQLKNHENTLNMILQLLQQQNNKVNSSMFLRIAACAPDGDTWQFIDGSENGPLKTRMKVNFSGHYEVPTFTYFTPAHGFTNKPTLPSELSAPGHDNYWRGSIEAFTTYFNTYLAQIPAHTAAKITFLMAFTNPGAALRLTYKYKDGKELEDYNYYQREQIEWYPVSFISGALDGETLSVAGIREFKYGGESNVIIGEPRIEWIGSEPNNWNEYYYLDAPEPFRKATLDLKNRKLTLINANNQQVVYDIDYSQAVLRQGYRNIPTKKIINSITPST